MSRLRKLALITALAASAGFAGAQAQEPSSGASASPPGQSDASPPAETPPEADGPTYAPLTERFLIDEVVRLRTDLERTRSELLERQNQREYAIAREATGYARRSIEFFVFIITAVASIALLIGWSALRDIRKRVRDIAQQQVEDLVQGYARRLDALETELAERTRRLAATEAEIEETNAIHSLWLRASQEPSPASKIVVYDEILQMRPDNVEALTFKADAALELNEPQWAISLSSRALGIDPESGQALYQRACALAWTERDAEALDDLAKAISASDAFRELARTDPAFVRIRDLDTFRDILGADVDTGQSGPAIHAV